MHLSFSITHGLVIYDKIITNKGKSNLIPEVEIAATVAADLGLTLELGCLDLIKLFHLDCVTFFDSSVELDSLVLDKRDTLI